MFSPAFTISQSALNPNTVTATDTSTGSDSNIVVRHIFFQTYAGNYLVQSGTTTDYEIWLLANTSQSFNILPQDYSVNVTVQWLDISGNVLYTLSDEFCLVEYNKQFLVYLGQQQAITPGILQDANYAMNLSVFWAYIRYAIDMVEIGADISNSQNLLDKATYMRLNESKFF